MLTHAFFYATILQFNKVFLVGMIFLPLILLRPVTNRLLRPKFRLFLWMMGWAATIFTVVNRWLGNIRLLPITLRSLLTPRADTSLKMNSSLPMYLPTDYTGPGTYTIALPGGSEIPFHLSDGVVLAITLVWWTILILLIWWDFRQNRRLQEMCSQGEKMDSALLKQYGLDPANTVVRICDGLPTSFVRAGHDTHRKDHVRYVVALQRELPQEEMDMVLLHESEHIRMGHPRLKTLITAVLYVAWWNPILWLAYRLTCRDMELACDEGVLEKLSPGQRKEYAKTLVELASGKPLWGAMTSFGECDAALRVKRVAAWKPQGEFAAAMLWIATAVLFLFLYTGQREGPWVSESVNWLNYVQGPALVDHLRDKAQRPDWEITEIWYRTTEQLLVQDGEGNWYHCLFHQGENRYWVSSIREIKPPDLSQPYYHQLRLWED